MNKFLLDLWHDLRRKHLLPVAMLLVAALVAVPVEAAIGAAAARWPTVTEPNSMPVPLAAAFS